LEEEKQHPESEGFGRGERNGEVNIPHERMGLYVSLHRKCFPHSPYYICYPRYINLFKGERRCEFSEMEAKV
jgi:hypothetical protein